MRLRATVCLSWWFRDAAQGTVWLIFVVMIVPLAALWLWVSHVEQYEVRLSGQRKLERSAPVSGRDDLVAVSLEHGFE
jgi:hypothetical protein